LNDLLAAARRRGLSSDDDERDTHIVARLHDVYANLTLERWKYLNDVYAELTLEPWGSTRPDTRLRRNPMWTPG
jgi:hypothetical protein